MEIDLSGALRMASESPEGCEVSADLCGPPESSSDIPSANSKRRGSRGGMGGAACDIPDRVARISSSIPACCALQKSG